MLELVQLYLPTHLPHFKTKFTFDQPHKLDVADSTVLLIIGYSFHVEFQKRLLNGSLRFPVVVRN